MNKINSNEDLYSEIISWLNITIGANYRVGCKSSQNLIDARLAEGYTLKDFIKVINKKSKEWYGTENEKYLCPNTLFGKNFGKFLNSERKEN